MEFEIADDGERLGREQATQIAISSLLMLPSFARIPLPAGDEIIVVEGHR
jgi:hypothetical protein